MKTLLIYVYLGVFKVFYTLFHLIPIQEKTLFWLTYGDNARPINDYVKENYPTEIRCLIYDRRFIKSPAEWKINYSLEYRPVHLIALAFHLATSKTVFVDNYVAEFGEAPIRLGTKRIQLWHAGGTLKEFGLTSSKSLNSSNQTRNRFKRVYERYGDIIVPGRLSVDLFMEPFGLPKNRFKTLGIPRTDYWFNESSHEIRHKLQMKYGKEKRRILLYAPTYREYGGSDIDAVQQLEQLTHQGWTVLVKLHPTIQSLFPNKLSHLHLLTDEFSVNDYLLITDVLITDYSSIPFESCLLEIPTILYTPDIDSYRQAPGIIRRYPEPLPVHYTTQMSDVLVWLNSEEALNESRLAMKQFKKSWYDKEPGNAVERIVDDYYEKK